MIQILHNPRCGKSRAGLKLLQEKGIEPEIIKYLDNTPTADEFKSILKKMGAKPTDVLRKNESIFKENYKGKEFTDDEWIEIMVNNPKLIERPIVINGDKAVLGRPAEDIEKVL
jgi:arsenate reductase